MADYECASISTFFRVTDEDRYAALIEGFASDVSNWTETLDGQVLHAFGNDNSIDWQDPKTGMWDLDKFYRELSKLLPDGEVVTVTFIGHEKLRYIDGAVTVITNHGTASKDLRQIAEELRRGLEETV